MVVESAATASRAQAAKEEDLESVMVVGALVVVAARAVADTAMALGTATTTVQTTMTPASTLTSGLIRPTTVLGGSTTEDEEDGMVAAIVLEDGTEDIDRVVFNGTTSIGCRLDRHSSRCKSFMCRTDNSRNRLLKSIRPHRA